MAPREGAVRLVRKKAHAVHSGQGEITPSPLLSGMNGSRYASPPDAALHIKQIQKHVARVLEEAEEDAEGDGGVAGDDDMGLVELEEKGDEEEVHDGVRTCVCACRLCGVTGAGAEPQNI